MDSIDEVLAKAKKKADELNKLAEETRDYGGVKIVREYLKGEKTYDEAREELLDLKKRIERKDLSPRERKKLDALDELLKEIGKK